MCGLATIIMNKETGRSINFEPNAGNREYVNDPQTLIFQ